MVGVAGDGYVIIEVQTEALAESLWSILLALVLGGMVFGILAGYVGYRLVKFLEAKLSGRKNAGKQIRR